ncbi:hypothetical protein PISMIDRAFT_231050 [Pisolithus microcarpus 441]|uniref:Unplaced genomic scaffold scaffold_15, whole genome shotgun sequence n=1 Tax=Pisolithus microcarpus 441 TaxID=765257 RepID=A0A0C9YP27_9AGAM|nr:hypothetical protein PISMIDRAFT_231050 [Pisolithus microcarpus 441]
MPQILAQITSTSVERACVVSCIAYLNVVGPFYGDQRERLSHGALWVISNLVSSATTACAALASDITPIQDKGNHKLLRRVSASAISSRDRCHEFSGTRSLVVSISRPQYFMKTHSSRHVRRTHAVLVNVVSRSES